MTNNQRAERAHNAAVLHGDEGEDLETLVYDLLTNLRHLCRIEKIDFNLQLAKSQDMHAMETLAPDDEDN